MSFNDEKDGDMRVNEFRPAQKVVNSKCVAALDQSSKQYKQLDALMLRKEDQRQL